MPRAMGEHTGTSTRHGTATGCHGTVRHTVAMARSYHAPHRVHFSLWRQYRFALSVRHGRFWLAVRYRHGRAVVLAVARSTRYRPALCAWPGAVPCYPGSRPRCGMRERWPCPRRGRGRSMARYRPWPCRPCACRAGRCRAGRWPGGSGNRGGRPAAFAGALSTKNLAPKA